MGVPDGVACRVRRLFGRQPEKDGGMKKTLRVILLMAVALVAAQSVLAEVVGEAFVQTESFRRFVDGQKALSEESAQLEAQRNAVRQELEANASEPRGTVHEVLIAVFLLLAALGVPGWAACMLMVASICGVVLYFIYLYKYNPMKWRLMTRWDTPGRLWRNLMRRNGLLSIMLFALILAPHPVQAATNVLQDIKMYYSANSFEKGYVLCKYAREKIQLGYSEVNGVPVIPNPEPGFERDYDVLAHLQGLGLGVAADDFVTLYGQADTDARRGMVYALLAMTGKDVAGDGARRIVEAMCGEARRNIADSIRRFKALLAAFAGSDNRLLANGLVRTFLEGSVGRVRNLEGLDEVVSLACEHDSFEIIREATASAMKTLPARLPFADSVYAARIAFRIDKDMARHYFQNIRFDFQEFYAREDLTLKLGELIRDLAGVTAFLPLYEKEALYTALRRLQNSQRVGITAFFDAVDPSLAAVAYGSIGMEPGELVFENPRSLGLLARLTSVYKKDQAGELLGALKRAVVEFKVPYGPAELFEAAERLGQTPTQFTESVLTQDMNTDCRYNQNDGLFLSLIRTLSPEQIRAYEGYFVKKSSLHAEVLDFLFASHKDAFHRLLLTLFTADPKSVAYMSFPNDIMDLRAVAVAFDKETVAAFSTLPAAYFVADQALSGPTPDVRTARKALIPEFDELFKTFLGSKGKTLSDRQAVTAMILLTLAKRPGATAFADEAAVLENMVTEYFGRSGDAGLSERNAAMKKEIMEAEAVLSDRMAAKRFGYVVLSYLAFVLCVSVAAGFLSANYACNVMVPGKNHFLLSYLIHAGEAEGVFVMSTVILFPIGLVMVVAAQLARGLQYNDTAGEDMRDGVAALERLPAADASYAAGRERGGHDS
jgi:hypothetical protein